MTKDSLVWLSIEVLVAGSNQRVRTSSAQIRTAALTEEVMSQLKCNLYIVSNASIYNFQIELQSE